MVKNEVESCKLVRVSAGVIVDRATCSTQKRIENIVSIWGDHEPENAA